MRDLLHNEPTKEKESFNTGSVMEEKEFGADLLKSVLGTIDSASTIKWLFGQEWEEALILIRLPKGMADRLSQMADVKKEFLESDRCKDCNSQEGCLILHRQSSELLLTTALKIGFASMTAQKLTQDL